MGGLFSPVHSIELLGQSYFASETANKFSIISTKEVSENSYEIDVTSYETSQINKGFNKDSNGRINYKANKLLMVNKDNILEIDLTKSSETIIPYVDDGDASFSISGTAAVGNTLSISEDSADPDGTGTLSYSWQTSSDNSYWSAVGTNSTYTVGSSDDGKYIKAVISYQDAEGFNETVTTSTSTIPNPKISSDSMKS